LFILVLLVIRLWIDEILFVFMFEVIEEGFIVDILYEIFGLYLRELIDCSIR